MSQKWYIEKPWDRSRDESSLEVYDITSGRSEVLREFDYLIEAPNWAPDGKSLVYNSRGRLYRFDLADKTSREIDSGYADNCNNDHLLSSDGRFVALSHDTREDGKSRVYVLPVDGGTPTLITPLGPSYLHGWSPDGKTLAYCAERNGEFDIYTIPAAGGVERRLTTAPGLNDGPEYDSSGEYIWFNSVRSGMMQVYRMKADGSEQTRMTHDDEWNIWFPHISPDREKVAMLAYRKGDVKPSEHLPHRYVELRLMDSDGGNMRTVVSLFGGQGTMNVNSWSPDSKKFAYVRYRIRGEEV